MVVHYARKQMKVLMNNNCVLISFLKSKSKNKKKVIDLESLHVLYLVN